MANRTVRLRVDGWSNSRFASVGEKSLSFEVMNLGCACPTCFARLFAVENRMKNSDLKWRLAQVQIPERGAPSAILVVEPEEMPKNVDAFFSNLLGLQIREIA